MRYSNLPSVSIERREHAAQPKKVFHIFCEGEKTEPDYISAYVGHLGHVPFTVKIVAPVGVAKTVVVEACAEKRRTKDGLSEGVSLEDTDEFWVVFDCDGEDMAYREAMHQASANDIKIACSNPCFELLLILHFEPYDSPDSHRALQKKLKVFCPEYNAEKHKSVNFDRLKNYYENAEKRAHDLRQKRASDGARWS